MFCYIPLCHSTDRETLTSAASVLASWQSVVSSHLARFSSHTAAGSSSSANAANAAECGYYWADPELALLLARLKEMLSLRTLVHDLTKALPPALSQQQQGRPGANSDAALAAQLTSGAVFSIFTNSNSSSSSDSGSGSNASAGGFDALLCAPHAQEHWRCAVAAFNNLLAPIETAVATVLTAKLRALQQHPALFVAECAAAASLLRRPAVKAVVAAETDALLAVLATVVSEREAEVAAKTAAGGSKKSSAAIAFIANGGGSSSNSSVSVVGGKNMTSAVAALVWCAQTLHKIKQISAITALLRQQNADSSASTANSNASSGGLGQALTARVRALFDKVTAHQKEVFFSWHEDVLALATDPHSPLNNAGAAGSSGATGTQIMALDVQGSGQLIVYFDDRLVALLREVRQVTELGYGRFLSPTVTALVERAQRNYRYALRVKQAANFFNSFHTEVVPSQLGLLLTDAQRFEEAIRRNAGVRWDRPDEAEGYLDALTDIMKGLERRNHGLRALHDRLVALVAELAAVSPARGGRGTWEDRLRQVAAVFANGNYINNSTTTPQAVAAWKAHWDQQLFKAVSVQFRLSLAALAETLPGLACELTLATKSIALPSSQASASGSANSNAASTTSGGVLTLTSVAVSPSLPDLRARLFRALKQLLDWPLTVTPLGGPQGHGAALLRLIPGLNPDAVAAVYTSAARTLGDLDALRAALDAKWGPALALAHGQSAAATGSNNQASSGAAVAGLDPLTALACETLTQLPHWNENFATHQRLQREAGAVPDKQKVGCFVVSLGPFKAALDEALTKYVDSILKTTFVAIHL